MKFTHSTDGYLAAKEYLRKNGYSDRVLAAMPKYDTVYLANHLRDKGLTDSPFNPLLM